MWFYIKLAWRNIFRNKRRTIITGLAIGIGLASLVFTDALIIGMKENMINSATSSFLGEAQIHRKNYRETQEVEKTIYNNDKVAAKIKKDNRVKNFSERVISYSMINSPANVRSVVVYGIDPKNEKYISEIDDGIIKGNYLKEENERGIVIGNKLAELLDVEIGDRVVVTVSQADTADLSQDMFLVSGIFKMHVEDLEKGTIFINKEKAQEMLGLKGKIHEIAITFNKSGYANNESTPFVREFTTDNNEAANWPTLFPQMKLVFQMTDFSTMILGVIIFGIVIFVIINTLFMSLYERLFEFGVLRAIGTRASGVRKMIVLEAGALGVISVIMGIILGYILTYIVSKVGIDYRGLEFVGTTFTKLLYPVMEIRQFILYPILVFLFTIVISLYPAVYAGKMKIAEALRKSL